MDESIKVIIASDVLPSIAEKSAFTSGEIEKLLDEKLLEIIERADMCLLNLECVLTGPETKESTKIGSHLRAPMACADIFNKFPNCVVNLANNHIFDYRDEGIDDTLWTLEKSGITYVGLSDEGVIKTINEKRIGVYSVMEHDFGCILPNDSKHYPNVVDDIKNAEAIRNIKKQCDKLVVLYHGGIEFYPYPTPEQQLRLRAYIDAGADLVVCQHNHIISAEEEWNNGKIIYGQGGFLFADRDEIKVNISDTEAMRHGMLVEWNPANNETKNIYYNIDNGYCSLDDTPKEITKVSDTDEVNKKWINYVKEHVDAIISVNPRYIEPDKRNMVNRIKRELRLLLEKLNGKSKERSIRARQTMACESTAELIHTIMEMKKHD